ncbi:uncharacterized protein BJ212DRAFT_1300520 [Suillus subaureus]|uniref:Uncharacterized protein n=1 Tax=Suillus subaureus TaxID=48587 RepID=A0A9P7E9H4_9AGAM|nr:uncharacterized protein BJ212DRAFT_1300520 [Suillus subaureus]KAG1814737.1 hypothetical protein BJ212DRAFT_1300520 [Suillus subaureus]
MHPDLARFLQSLSIQVLCHLSEAPRLPKLTPTRNGGGGKKSLDHERDNFLALANANVKSNDEAPPKLRSAIEDALLAHMPSYGHYCPPPKPAFPTHPTLCRRQRRTLVSSSQTIKKTVILAEHAVTHGVTQHQCFRISQACRCTARILTAPPLPFSATPGESKNGGGPPEVTLAWEIPVKCGGFVRLRSGLAREGAAEAEALQKDNRTPTTISIPREL